MPGLLLLALGSCALDETEFIPEYATLYCDYFLRCADPALLAFDGIDTPEECEALYGPDIEAEGEGCKLARSEARKCLRAMEGLPCPADPTDLESGIPPVCDYTWKKCIAKPAGDPTGETPDDTAPPPP